MKMLRFAAFLPPSDVRGRGKQETTLTKWWFQHPHASLFDLLLVDEEQIKVAIDGQIFFDLFDPSNGPKESQSLLAHWLPTQLEYSITPEISHEINALPSNSSRQAYRKRERSYTKANT